ncbi:hypothetical protein SDC9_137659 [bioreactor metagenome]|uniref:Uncharacterized protein n=1 Tax=bioreactor metagenome TaxID=1076179 RepID=A0A645DN59_9ZZZZ
MWQILKRFFDQADAFQHFQSTHYHPGTYITGGLHGSLDAEFPICSVRKFDPQIRFNARGTGGRTHSAEDQCLFTGEDAHAIRSGFDGCVCGKDGYDHFLDCFLDLPHRRQYAFRIGDIAVDAADAIHGVINTVARNGFQYIHYSFA